MQQAPPVTYPLGKARVAILWTVVVWASGLMAVVLWLTQSDIAPWRQSLSQGLLIVCGLAAGYCCLKMPTGQLAWTGQQWFWTSSRGQTEGKLAVCLDFQNVLLVRFRPLPGRAMWLWVERGRRPERWLELRRAVHARRRQSPARTDSGVVNTK
jgi:toxin CptA